MSTRDGRNRRVIYEHLRQSILELRLAPGARLDRQRLCERFNLSKAPYREAVAKLAEEGLVEVRSRHRTHVRPIVWSDVLDGLTLRTALEVEATRRAAERCDARLSAVLRANLDRQVSSLRRGDLTRLHQLDEQLHWLILRGAEPGRSGEWFELIKDGLVRAHRFAVPTNKRPDETVNEHGDIVVAICAGRSDAAAAAMRNHLGRTGAALAAALTSADPNPEATQARC